MNDQVMPPNSAGAGERGGGARPEDLQAGAAGGETAAPEVSPQPGSSPAPPPPAQPKLSRDDVAAAISAIPGGGTPPAGVPTGGTANPAVAADVDVIEPEWVNKAEEAVRTHQGDPYGEEEAVEELQEDYLQKRYGFSVQDPNKERGGGSTGKPGGA